MKRIILFCLIASIALGATKEAKEEDVILTGDIILTAKNIASTKTKTPNWLHAFDKEASKYEYLSKQSSLAVLRSTGRGNCVAFAKLGAWYAIHEGYKCKFISIAHGKDGHMFLYASRDNNNWVVSNDTYRQVDSIKDAIFRMNAFGSIIMRETDVTLSNIESHGTQTLEANGIFLQNLEPNGRIRLEYPLNNTEVDNHNDNEYNINQ